MSGEYAVPINCCGLPGYYFWRFKILNDEKSQILNFCEIHDFEEEYYGWQCKNCDCFIPFGCEPWVDEEEPEENFCHFCGKNIYDFDDIGCGHCDARHPDFGIVFS